jgi:CRISPR-associated endonuclease/helicase Cas3
VPDRDRDQETETRRQRPVFCWAGRDSDRSAVVSPDQIRPNELIIVPADYGGCDEWGWAPESEKPVRDLAEEAAQRFASRHYALRLTSKLIEKLASEPPDGDDQQLVAERERTPVFVAAFSQVMADLADGLVKADAPVVIAALQAAQSSGRIAMALAQLAVWRTEKRPRPQLIMPYGEDGEGRPLGVVLLAPNGISAPPGEARESLDDGGEATSEDDRLGSTPRYAQTLAQHSYEVRSLASRFSRDCGLLPAIAEDISLAAYLHDAGKADPRFQAMLYGGDWSAVDDARILAKSEKPMSRNAWSKSGLPEKWRHEALSVRIAREHDLFRQAHDPLLVLWLVGTHHGYGRPFFPHGAEEPPVVLPDVLGGIRAWPGPGPQSLAFSFDGWDWAQIFERLNRDYGVWELARMEAILRLADHRASEAAGRRHNESEDTAR